MSTPAPRSPRKPPAECGTRSGYARHKRLREDACQDCADANAPLRAARRRHARIAALGQYVPPEDRPAPPDTLLHARDGDTWPGRP